MNAQTILLVLAAIITVGILGAQFNSTQRLRAQVAALRSAMGEASARETDGVSRLTLRPRAQNSTAAEARLGERLDLLERTVAQLTRDSEYLVRRGQLPMNTNQLEAFQRQFADLGAAERDRLQALRQLRRAGPLTDEQVHQAIAWVQSSTNANMRRDVLAQLEGVTNAALRGPLLQLAVAEADANVREQAVENLQSFIADPQVEAQLWKTLLSDADSDVRDQARDALVDGPMPEARKAALQQRALNPEASLDEKLVALRALNEADVTVPQLTAALGELARTSTDQALRLRLFREFEDLNDPSLKAPLVYGLQDPSPLVREQAAESLRDHRSDPTVAQWLRYVAENDADSGVRREALDALDDE